MYNYGWFTLRFEKTKTTKFCKAIVLQFKKEKERERERERAWELFIFWNALFQHTFFFSLNKFLRAVLGLQRNWEGRTEISHVLLASAHAWSPQESASLTNISRLFFFFSKDELTWTWYNYSKSIFYLRVHSWCCTLYGLGQMYKDICLSL